MDISKADDIHIGSVPVQSAWLGGRKVWDRTERKIMRSMVCWYDISCQGCTNEAMAQNPVLKDLSGNGNDMTCYNFAWSGMSGIGGYPFSSTFWRFRDNIALVKETDYKWIISSMTVGVLPIIHTYDSGINIRPAYTIKISGMPEDVSAYLYEDSSKILTNGINYVEERRIDASQIGQHVGIMFTNSFSNQNVIIEFIPLYPGALVSDGVDDCCFVEGLPTLTDYTVVARRLYSGFEQTGNVNASLASKREAAASEDGAFQFERFSGEDIKTFNFGAGLDIKEAIDGSPSVSWQTAGSYNGAALPVGTAEDTQSMSLFCLRKGSAANALKAALYSLILFDRTLTDAEIEWVKINLMDAPPTPYVYYDCSLYTNETIDSANPVLKDLSGHGHDLVLKNFAFAGMSGFGGYSWDFTDFTNNYTRTASKVVINTDGSVTYNSNVFQKRIEIEPGYVNRGAKVKVTGITGNGSFDFYNGSTVVSVSQDGEYEVDDYASAEGETYMYYGFKRLDSISAGVLVEIELIPYYGKGLVFDGVDDYGITDRDGFDKCTMFLLFKPLINADNISVDIRFNKTGNFAIYRRGDSIAYNDRNSNGTIINNVINTKTYCRDLVNKKHLVIIKGNCAKNSRVICLGANDYHTGNFDNMVLYKFLLFDRELTQKEIDKVIQDYHLLDGVDDVWNEV